MRNRTQHAVVLFGLLPTWLAFFALSVLSSYRDAAYPPARIQFSAQREYPVVLGERSERLGARALQAGDEIIRWGERSLRRAGQTQYFSAVAAETPSSHIAQVQVRRDGWVLTLPVRTESWRRLLPRVIAAPVFLVVALILLYRAPPSALRFNIIGFLLSVAFLFSTNVANPPWLIVAGTAIQLLGVSGLGYFAVRAFLMFPHGEPPRGWLRFLPWPFLLMGPLDIERSTGMFISQDLAHHIQMTLSNSRNAIVIASMIVNYVRANPVERRKIKWVMWGLYVALGIASLASLPSLASPQLAFRYYVLVASFVTIPAVLLIAMLRFNLFDIDHVLSVTAAYSIGGCGLLVSAMTLAPRLSVSIERWLSVPQAVTQLCVSTVAVSLLWFCQHTLSPWIERWAARGKPTLASELERITFELRASLTPSAAMTALGEQLTRVLAPRTLAIYCRFDREWSNVFAHGPNVAPTLLDDCEIIRRMVASPRPLSCESDSGEPSERAWSDAYARSFISGLGVSLILPVLRDGQLFGLVCLGQKSSEDIYVHSEVALLHALCQVLSERLARFDTTAVLAEVRQLRDELQRYVPGAVVESLRELGAVETGEREVTVMFIDIRGYSSFAEGRALPLLFSRLNEHTEQVSAIVRRHGGHIVEFNGDGMMAVYGAPSLLANKERAAVLAGESICELMNGGDLPHAARFRVGVGIASGEAYVGSLRAVDRLIWTAIGETTNRAARLQTLTRDLDTSMIVDEKTWLALGSLGDQFALHRGRALRGLLRRHNVFARVTGPGAATPAAVTSVEPLALQE